MSDIGEALQQLALQAMDVAIDAFTNGEPNPFVFFVDGSGESHTVVIAADEGTEGSDLVAIARQTVSQSLGHIAQLYALAYDGYLTTNGEKFDAVFVEAGERGEAKASLIAQRYRVRKRSGKVEKVGPPTIVDSAGQLLGPIPRMKTIPLFQDEAALPTELGGLSYVGCDLYDDARLGVKLRYGNDSTKVDAYLYDLGLRSIPFDIRSDAVAEFFQQACGEVLAMADRGMYLDFETRASRYLHLPDDAPEPMYLWAAFRYRQAPGPSVADDGFRFSHVFIRTDSGYINKVRYTYPERVASRAGGDMIRFLLDWHGAIPRT